MKNIRSIFLILGAILLIALTETGRTAVNRHYDYAELTAAKSLHQLSQETRAGADEDGKGHLMLYGAGLFAAALLALGLMLFAMRSGQEFGKRAGKRARRGPAAGPRVVNQPQELPPLPTLPRARNLSALPPGDGYEDIRR